MVDVWIVLGVYLILVSVVMWGLMTQPAVVGYFFCGVVAVANVALVYASQDWPWGNSVSLLWTLAYIASIVLMVGVVLVVGGKVYRAYKVHLERLRMGPEAGPQEIDLDLATKGIVLGSAAGGTAVVVYLILSRQVFFLRPGEMWLFYLWLGVSAFVIAAVWLDSFLKRRRKQR